MTYSHVPNRRHSLKRIKTSLKVDHFWATVTTVRPKQRGNWFPAFCNEKISVWIFRLPSGCLFEYLLKSIQNMFKNASDKQMWFFGQIGVSTGPSWTKKNYCNKIMLLLHIWKYPETCNQFCWRDILGFHFFGLTYTLSNTLCCI